MRIAIVGNFGLTYKATMSARALPLAQELARRGHVVTMFLPSDDGLAPTQSLADGLRLISLGPTPSEFHRQFGVARGIGYLWLAVRLAWGALRFRPDVLYTYKPKAYAGLALLIFWLLREFGLVRLTLSLDTDDWEGAGGWADRQGAPPWQRWLITWHERWCLQHADMVTVASRALAGLAADQHVSAIYLPNATSPASPGWLQGSGRPIRDQLHLSNQPVVLAYTRFVEFAPERLIQVFAAIHQRVPAAHFLVAGQGLAGEDLQFGELAKALQIEEFVHLLGWVSPATLPDVFAAADIAVYPLDDTLLNRTKCPMKLVDLLLAGVPVVADAVGQANEYVEDERTGLLAAPGNVEDMASKAVGLLTNTTWRDSLGQAARSTVPRKWSWAEQASSVEAEFQCAVDRTRKYGRRIKARRNLDASHGLDRDERL